MKEKVQFGRLPRLFDETGEAWYHLYNRLSCFKDVFPLEERSEEGKSVLMKYISFYSQAYECELATFVVMGNHFHIMVRFPHYVELSREELEERVKAFYPNTFGQSEHWSDEKWESFNRRLFDVSSYMRNIQQGFATWYNKTFKHRGRVWADRFKSTLFYGEESMMECMKYIDLNPVRAGLITKPEDYKFGAMRLRELRKVKHLVKLRSLLDVKRENEAYQEYKYDVYARGSVKTKENQHEIKIELNNNENSEEDASKGMFSSKKRFFIDGLVIGNKEKIEEWLKKCHANQLYRRRKNPIELEHCIGYSLREQRSHFEKKLE